MLTAEISFPSYHINENEKCQLLTFVILNFPEINPVFLNFKLRNLNAGSCLPPFHLSPEIQFSYGMHISLDLSSTSMIADVLGSPETVNSLYTIKKEKKKKGGGRGKGEEEEGIKHTHTKLGLSSAFIYYHWLWKKQYACSIFFFFFFQMWSQQGFLWLGKCNMIWFFFSAFCSRDLQVDY